MALGKKKAASADNSGAEYMSTVYGLARSARAWRLVAIILGGIAIALLYFYFSALNSMPVRLIPYDYAINEDVNTVNQSGGVDANYLSRLAIADVQLYNNWTPQTVKRQYKRFLNRTAPSLYATEQISLIDEAEKKGGGIRTRSFFPRDTKVIEGRVVEVYGRLKRFQGQELLSNEQVRFRVKYRTLHGVPYIYSMSKEASK